MYFLSIVIIAIKSHENICGGFFTINAINDIPGAIPCYIQGNYFRENMPSYAYPEKIVCKKHSFKLE